MEGQPEEIEAAHEALTSPVWELYLGRKNCVPTEFIAQGIFHSYDHALTKMHLLREQKKRFLAYTVKQGSHDGEVFSLNDVPLCFGPKKQYADRLVTVIQEA